MRNRGFDITVAVGIADPALAKRVADALDRPGLYLLATMADGDVEADVAVTDREEGVPGVPTIILSGEDRPPASWGSWIRAVLAPDANEDVLAAVVELVARGFMVLSAESLERGRAAGGLGGDSRASLSLTPRERQVLSLLAEGASNKQIARRLGVAFSTAKFHVASVLDKLGARTRTEAVAEGARRGLVML